jgi:SAM-dependent methyltransferase
VRLSLLPGLNPALSVVAQTASGLGWTEVIGVLEHDEIGVLRSLKETLMAAGYTRERVARATAAARYAKHPALHAGAAVLALEDEPDERFALLASLFGFGRAVPRRRLGDLDVDGLAGLGVVDADGESIRPRMHLDELDGLYVLSDVDPDGPEAVAGVSGSGWRCAVYTPRPQVDSVLDVGAGSGMQALLCARHARRVVATDVNPRALELTDLNVALNGFAHVETRIGSYMEPVAGERFDMIVANPPYVMAPEARVLRRDSGSSDDTLSRMLLDQLPEHVNEGGLAVLQGQWAHASEGTWWRSIADVLSGRGIDGFAIRHADAGPLEHAIFWARGDHPGDPDGFADTVRRWRDSYRALGIERIATAVVVMRRRARGAPNWLRCVTDHRGRERLLGDDMVELLATQDALARGQDCIVTLAPDAGVEAERLASYSALDQRRPCSEELAELLPALRDGLLLSELPPVLHDEIVALAKVGYVRVAR